MIKYALYRSNATGRRGSRLGTIVKLARGYRYVDMHGLKGPIVKIFDDAIPAPWTIGTTQSELVF